MSPRPLPSAGEDRRQDPLDATVRIKAYFFFFEDSSPFDNEITVKQPLILVPAGAPFPAGQSAGGTATETDPQTKKWWDQ